MLGFFNVDGELATAQVEGDAIVGGGAFHGNVSLAHVFEDLFHRALEGITEPAATGAFDPHGVVRAQPVVSEPRRQALFIQAVWIDDAGAFAAVRAAFPAPGSDQGGFGSENDV